jgi:hypothetical protein
VRGIGAESIPDAERMDPHSCCDRTRRSRIRRRQLALIGAAVLAALVACGDPYLHTNPYDPAYPLEMTISGPDTLFSFEEIGQYTAQTNPPWSDTGFVWGIDTFSEYFIPPPPPTNGADPCWTLTVRGDTALKGNGNGAYQSILPPLEPYSFKISIEASVGTIDTVTSYMACRGPVEGRITAPRHTGYKTVVITQRVTRIQLRCPDTHACDPIAVGDSAFIWVDGFDAHNKQIVALTSSTANPATGNPLFPYITTDTAILRVQATNNPVVTYVSRDTTIARTTAIGIRVARVTPVKSGSTWVVATRGALADSLQIVVP